MLLLVLGVNGRHLSAIERLETVDLQVGFKGPQLLVEAINPDTRHFILLPSSKGPLSPEAKEGVSPQKNAPADARINWGEKFAAENSAPT